MTKFDRHVSAQFFKVSLFAIVAFSMIFILIDMIENLDDFLDQHVLAHIILTYYAYFLPRILGLMVPLAMLLSSLFVVGRMSTTNELTIIKCSGVSLYRFMVPFLVIGLLVSGLMLVFDGWMVPRVNAARLVLEREYMKKHLQSGTRSNLFFQDVDQRIVSLEYYDEASNTARRVSVQQFSREDPTIMTRRIDAASMRWAGAEGAWVLHDGFERRFRSTRDRRGEEIVTRFDSLRLGSMTVNPTVIVRMQQKPEEMELGAFRDYITRQQLAGSDTARLFVDYYGKIAFPFASLIVVFFGVPFASVKRRSGLSVQFGISIFICFVYLVSQKLSQVTGYNGSIPPVYAAWLPNGLFLLAGAIIAFKVRK